MPRLTEQSKFKAYNAGLKAAKLGEPFKQVSGWGWEHGLYYKWFKRGYDGQPFVDEIVQESFGLMRARRLIAAEFRARGQEGYAKQYEHGGFSTAPLAAFAKYIEATE